MSEPIRKDVAAARRDLANMRRIELNLPAELVVNRLERILDWADRELAVHTEEKPAGTPFCEHCGGYYDDAWLQIYGGHWDTCPNGQGFRQQALNHLFADSAAEPEPPALAAEPEPEPAAPVTPNPAPAEPSYHYNSCNVPNAGSCFTPWCQCWCHKRKSDVALSR